MRPGFVFFQHFFKRHKVTGCFFPYENPCPWSLPSRSKDTKQLELKQMGEFSTGRSFQCLSLREKQGIYSLIYSRKVVFYSLGGRTRHAVQEQSKGFQLSSFKSGENIRYLLIKPTLFFYLIFHSSWEEIFALLCALIIIIVSSQTAVKSQLKTYFENTSRQCDDVIRCITRSEVETVDISRRRSQQESNHSSERCLERTVITCNRHVRHQKPQTKTAKKLQGEQLS